MPILLTTPLNTGDIDSVNYNEVKILEMTWVGEQSFLRVLIQYGNTVNSAWVAGKNFNGPVKQNPCYHVIEGQDYIDLMGTVCSGTDVNVYGAIKEALYVYLNNKGLYSGTII